MTTTHAMQFLPVNTAERKKIDMRAGDTIRVWQRIQEGDKTRLQAFEGLVIARKHGAEPGATFTLRKVTEGVGVERIFPLYSPTIEKIELIRRSKVRRAKLYYIREKAAKEIRYKMKQIKMMSRVLSEKAKEVPQEKVEEKTEENAAEQKLDTI